MCSLFVGAHYLWVCITHGHILVMGMCQLWVGGCHWPWALAIHVGGSLLSMGGALSSVQDGHRWVVGSRVVVFPVHCHLGGQAPVCGHWVLFVGARCCLWALGIVCEHWVICRL